MAKSISPADQLPRIDYLDWLRALAAGLVVIGHSHGSLAPGGPIGVSVFFVLSGYLITSILLRDGMMTGGNIVKFIARRIARIYPMYVFQIAVMAVFLATFRRDDIGTLLEALPGLLFFATQSPQHIGPAIGVLWTLYVEFWFYLTFPVLLCAMMRTGRLIPCIFVMIAISLAAKLQGANETLQYYDHFLIGSLCAVLIKRHALPTIFSARWLFGAAFFGIIVVGQIPYPGTRDLGWFSESLSAAALTGVAILAGHARRPQIELPWLAYLGRISYSIYLMHAAVLDAFVLYNNHLNLPRFALYLPIVLILSSITYFTIEQPFIRLVHRRVRFSVQPGNLSASPALLG
jgi:peptidoglycan/LPS O-acetylase OafA/YrhL